MNKWLILSGLSFVLFIPFNCFAEMTCEQCTALKSEINSLDNDLKKIDDEIRELYKNRKYSDVKKKDREITEIATQIADKSKLMDKSCKDACNPETVLKTKISTLIQNILQLEEENAETELIDKKYTELAKLREDLADKSHDEKKKR